MRWKTSISSTGSSIRTLTSIQASRCGRSASRHLCSPSSVRGCAHGRLDRPVEGNDRGSGTTYRPTPASSIRDRKNVPYVQMKDLRLNGLFRLTSHALTGRGRARCAQRACSAFLKAARILFIHALEGVHLALVFGDCPCRAAPARLSTNYPALHAPCTYSGKTFSPSTRFGRTMECAFSIHMNIATIASVR